MPPSKQRRLTAFFGNERVDTTRITGAWDKRKRARTNYSFPLAPDASRFGSCPLCQRRLPIHVLLSHAESCDGAPVPASCDGVSTKVKDTIQKTEVTSDRCFPDASSEDSVDIVPTDLEARPSSAMRQEVHNQENLWWKQTKLDQHRVENPLFPTSEPIPGLFLYENFITKDEEEMILAELDGHDHRDEFLPWKLASFNGPHYVKRWGVHCNLRDRRVSAPEHALPHFIRNLLLSRFQRVDAMVGCIPNEANAIDYRRKQGHYLQSHVDDRQLSKEPIANLSVAGDCYMTFRNERKGAPASTHRIMLKRRTLQVLTGKARYDFSHGIRKEDILSDRRVSVTMRESPLTKSLNS